MSEFINKSMQRRPRRTHKELTEVLFEAVSKMLSDQKFRTIGINDLTEFANIDKNFIYKHYGDIDSLLREYVKRNDYWGKIILSPETYQQMSFKEMFSFLLQGLYSSFSESIDFQNIIRWEVASSNEYIKENTRNREKEAAPLIEYANIVWKQHPEKDIPCLFALLTAGIYYLILHKNISTFVGIDFTDKSQSDRIIGVLAIITEYFFEDYVKTKTIVEKLLKKNMSVYDISEILNVNTEYVEGIKNSLEEL